ncbi:MAG TPA: hypothetical protein VF118_14715 [Gemmatimonadaceae bacterium]
MTQNPSFMNRRVSSHNGCIQYTQRRTKRLRAHRTRYAFLIASVAVVAACASDQVAGPNTAENAELILHFDSLMHSTTDAYRKSTYWDIAAILAEGAPVGAATIKVNGVTHHFNAVAELLVTRNALGVTFDSDYTIAGWQGDGTDSTFDFLKSDLFNTLVTTFGAASMQDFDASTRVTLGPPRGLCRSFLSVTPSDIGAPTPLECFVQVATDSFWIVTNSRHGDTVVLHSQPLTGIRVLRSVAAPPP